MTTSTAPVWEGKLFSAGWRAGSGEPLTVTAPGSGRHIGTVGTATPADLDTAVAAAKEAQREWAAVPYSVRANVMLKAAQLLEANPARLMDVLVSEAGPDRPRARRVSRSAWSLMMGCIASPYWIDGRGAEGGGRGSAIAEAGPSGARWEQRHARPAGC